MLSQLRHFRSILMRVLRWGVGIKAIDAGRVSTVHFCLVQVHERCWEVLTDGDDQDFDGWHKGRGSQFIAGGVAVD